MPTATVTSNGRVTIPKTVRELLRVDAGDRVNFIVTEHGEIIVRRVTGDIRDLKGLLKRPQTLGVSVEEMNKAILRHHAGKL